jgi:LPXTG-motif cell wall-anchored protein
MAALGFSLRVFGQSRSRAAGLREVLMRWFAAVLSLVACLLMAAPALAAESFVMDCPNCDHIDAAGKGMEPNAVLVVNIKDLRTGEHVIPETTTVRTDASGSFSAEFDVDLAAHPSTEGSVYDRDGTSLVLAAHTRFSAPAHCARTTSLPRTGAATRALAVLGTALVAGGVLVLATTRSRAGRRAR